MMAVVSYLRVALVYESAEEDGKTAQTVNVERRAEDSSAIRAFLKQPHFSFSDEASYACCMLESPHSFTLLKDFPYQNNK